MSRSRRLPTLGHHNIVCPYCEAQSLQEVKDDYSKAHCPKCSNDFTFFLTSVRAKRGRASRGQREYVIRYFDRYAGEGELRFIDGGGSDLDIRSGDVIYACHKLDKNKARARDPSILCNLTINQYVKIKKAGCFMATVTCGYDSWEVKVLSSFRDMILMRNRVGRLLIASYYAVSPYLSFAISDKDIPKSCIRALIVSPFASLISRLYPLESTS